MNLAAVETALDRFLGGVDLILKADEVPVFGPLPASADWRRIHRLIEDVVPEMRRDFLRAVSETNGAMSRAAVARALEADDIEAAVRAIPWQEAAAPILSGQFMRRFRDVFDAAGTVSARIIPGVDPFDVSVVDPRPFRFLEQHGADLVRQISEDTRQGLRQTLTQMLDQGLSPQRTAQLIQGQIGLTTRMQNAVNAARQRMLDAGMPVRNARLQAERYAQRLLRNRAQTIARTEAQFAASAGQEEAWRQAADKGLVDQQQADRVWDTALDERVCPICMPLNRVARKIGEPFAPGIMRPPAHPNCRCGVHLVPHGQQRNLRRAA